MNLSKLILRENCSRISLLSLKSFFTNQKYPLSQRKSLAYNDPISSKKLSLTIYKNLKDVTGLDGMRATILKNLHPNSVTYLLSSFNSIFSQNTYPSSEKTPLFKPNSDPTLPVSYHPIALTNVLEKLFQKIRALRIKQSLISFSMQFSQKM